MVRTLLVAAFAATLSTAHAVPIQLTHQGALGDAAGEPVNGLSAEWGHGNTHVVCCQ